MILEDKWITLKDGRKAVIRNPREEDIEGTLNYLRVSAQETEFILRYPEECSKYTYEGWRGGRKLPDQGQYQLKDETQGKHRHRFDEEILESGDRV